MNIDRHHIVHERREWSLRPEANFIRESPGLILPIEREAHNELHRNCPAVPLLGYHALLRTRSLFEEGDDQLQSTEHLMTAIEQASKHPKAHIIEKHLAELAVWSLDLQRPYIADALGRSL